MTGARDGAPSFDDALEAAADWFDRQGQLTATERASFNAWLAADEAHARAYAVIRQAMLDPALVQAAQGAGQAAPATVVEPASGRSREGLSRWISLIAQLRTPWVGGPAVAALAGLAVLAVVFMTPAQRAPDTAIQPTSYATRTGEARTVDLADASTIHVGPESQLSVDVVDGARAVILSQGEAACTALPAFQAAQPARQPDYVAPPG